MFKSLSKDNTGIDFENKLNYKDSLSVLDFEYMFNGAGVALLDVNKDGLTDVFFTGNYVSARLYLNKGNMKFEDITAKAGLKTQGWCYGASVVDINQDGYPDIYISKAGSRGTPPEKMHNLFFINNSPSPSPKKQIIRFPFLKEKVPVGQMRQRAAVRLHSQNQQQKWVWMMMVMIFMLHF
ncbi:MAG: VCBS repeat-containing protein [Segetibacter sp.]